MAWQRLERQIIILWSFYSVIFWITQVSLLKPSVLQGNGARSILPGFFCPVLIIQERCTDPLTQQGEQALTKDLCSNLALHCNPLSSHILLPIDTTPIPFTYMFSSISLSHTIIHSKPLPTYQQHPLFLFFHIFIDEEKEANLWATQQDQTKITTSKQTNNKKQTQPTALMSKWKWMVGCTFYLVI